MMCLCFIGSFNFFRALILRTNFSRIVDCFVFVLFFFVSFCLFICLFSLFFLCYFVFVSLFFFFLLVSLFIPLKRGKRSYGSDDVWSLFTGKPLRN